MTDYYETLNVTNEATTEEIKKAHRGLMKKHHPDKNDGALTQRCRDIQEAYDCLSKPESRAHYDEYGLAQATKQFEAVQKLAIQVSTQFLTQGVAPGLFIPEMQHHLEQELTEHKNNLQIIDSNIEKINTQRSAVKLKDDNQMDLVGAALEEMIEQQLANKSQLQDTIAIYEILLKNVDHYEQ
jgi:DnaJ-class molecular chaperone